jgi:hypothetical protein
MNMTTILALAPEATAPSELEDAADMLDADAPLPRFATSYEPLDEDDLDAQIHEHETFVKSWYEGVVGAWE